MAGPIRLPPPSPPPAKGRSHQRPRLRSNPRKSALKSGSGEPPPWKPPDNSSKTQKESEKRVSTSIIDLQQGMARFAQRRAGRGGRTRKRRGLTFLALPAAFLLALILLFTRFTGMSYDASLTA